MPGRTATTISASARVRVTGIDSPATASAVASRLGEMLGAALRSTTDLAPSATPEKPRAATGGDR